MDVVVILLAVVVAVWVIKVVIKNGVSLYFTVILFIISMVWVVLYFLLGTVFDFLEPHYVIVRYIATAVHYIDRNQFHIPFYVDGSSMSHVFDIIVDSINTYASIAWAYVCVAGWISGLSVSLILLKNPKYKTMVKGAVHVMIIWAGIYLVLGAVSSVLRPHIAIAEIVISATHKRATVSEFVADPNYDVTMAEMKEYYGKQDDYPVGDIYTRMSYFSRTLNVKGETSIMSVVYDIAWFINIYALTAWSWFCGIYCFIGMKNIFKARKESGDNGI